MSNHPLFSGTRSTGKPRALAAVAIATLVVAAPDHAQAQVPADDVQMAAALLAAPEGERAGATVLGWSADGTTKVLRQGSNALVCLADDPGQEGWSVACYHRSIEPFMARGRELRAQGVTDPQEVTRIRFEEAEAGTLPMPEEPAMLYVMTGDAYDASTGSVTNPYTRWVLYTPWATLEETGLPGRPTAPGQPWLMAPGTPGAHVMIMPPRPGS